MHLLALQNQHGACFKTEQEKRNCFLFYLFSILCASLQDNLFEVWQDPV